MPCREPGKNFQLKGQVIGLFFKLKTAKKLLELLKFEAIHDSITTEFNG